MAGEEKKDRLFEMNLGGGLIELDDEKGKTVSTDADEGKEKETETKGEPVKGEGFTVNEDGTIEINEFSQETTDDSDKGEEESGEHIEKTESESKEGETPSGDGSGDSSPSSSQYLAFARDRAKEGVFLPFSDEDWETLKERNEGDEAAALRELSLISVQQMVADGIEQYKESLTEEDRALYEAKEKGVPVDKYGIAKRNMEEFSKIKLTDLADDKELQIKVVSKALELKGFSPEEIKEEIEGYETLENLQVKAEKALPVIPKIYKKQLDDLDQTALAEEKSRQDNLRQRVAKMKLLVDQTPEIIPGIQLNKATKDKIMRSMMEPVATDSDGNPLNPVMATRARNPEAFEMMIHYFHLLGLFNIDENGIAKPDFSKIAKTEKKKATDEFRSVFESKEKTVTGKTKTVKTEDDEMDDWGKAFNRI